MIDVHKIECLGLSTTDFLHPLQQYRFVRLQTAAPVFLKLFELINFKKINKSTWTPTIQPCKNKCRPNNRKCKNKSKCKSTKSINRFY